MSYQYFPIRLKSHNSILYGLGTIEEYIEKAKELNLTSLGIAERYTGSSLYSFVKSCRKNNINPIPGVELSLLYDNNNFDITIYAYNNDGIKELFKLIDLSYENKNKEIFEMTEKFLKNKKDKLSEDDIKEEKNKYFARSADLVKPYIEIKDIPESKNIFILTGYNNTQLRDFVNKGQGDEMRTHLLAMIKKVGLENVFLSVESGKDEMIKLSKVSGLKALPSHEVLFLNEKYQEVCDLMMSKGAKVSLNETPITSGGKRPISSINNVFIADNNSPNLAHINNENLYQLKDIDINSFQELYKNLQELSEKVSVDFEYNAHLRPSIGNPEEELKQFKKLIAKGFNDKRKGTKYEKLSKERIKEELDTIWGNDYISYFLIVADYIRMAKESAGGVGAGRGSAGGSEISYLLGIHNTDPLRHELLFERFLSPGRGSEFTIYLEDGQEIKSMISDKHKVNKRTLYTHQLEEGMQIEEGVIKSVKITRPSASSVDIDTDFHTTGREKVFEYVRNKYTQEKVASIIAFGTFKAVSSIKTLCSIYNIPTSISNRVSDFISPDADLRDVLYNPTNEADKKARNDLIKLFSKIKDQNLAKKILANAVLLQGRYSNETIHPCGMLISPVPLKEVIPCQRNYKDNGSLMTQWPYEDCEAIGLIKMDFLGLKTVDLINGAIDNIKKTRNIEIKQDDIINSNLDNTLTYKLFQEGNTTGIFQYSSDGVKDFLKKLKPDNFSDLFSVTALYRPGPMGMGAHESFAKRKSGEESRIPFDNPKFIGTSVEEVLKETYGLIPFQETLMKLARVCADFSPYETDLLRKATAKKKEDLLVSLKPKFLEGIKNKVNTEIKARNNNDTLLTDNDMENLWQQIIAFAAYSFNKSHSVSYALNAYIAGYLKANYPAEFMATVLHYDADDKKKVKLLMEDIKATGVEIINPDINFSMQTTQAVEKDGEYVIALGFDIIARISNKVADIIVTERETNGQYKNLTDCFTRLNKYNIINKTTIEALSAVGMFDCFNIGRKGIYNSVREITSFLRKHETGTIPKTKGLFSITAPANELSIPDENFTFLEKLALEKDITGLFLSGEPMSKIQQGDTGNDIAINFTNEEMIKKYQKSQRFKEFICAETDNGNNIKQKFKIKQFLGFVSDISIKTNKYGRKQVKILIETGKESIIVFPGQKNGNPDLPLTSTGKLIETGKMYNMTLNSYNNIFFNVIDIEEVLLKDDGSYKSVKKVPLYKGE